FPSQDKSWTPKTSKSLSWSPKFILDECYAQNLCFELGTKKAYLLTKIKTWYNGYSWNTKDRVYNPYSILSLFVEQQFVHY
ncbi:MAG: AAA family ATPase, partial [Pseudomonadota bacterium]